MSPKKKIERSEAMGKKQIEIQKQIEVITQEQAVLRALADIQQRLSRIEAAMKRE